MRIPTLVGVGPMQAAGFGHSIRLGSSEVKQDEGGYLAEAIRAEVETLEFKPLRYVPFERQRDLARLQETAREFEDVFAVNILTYAQQDY